MHEGTNCFLQFKSNMEIKVHFSVYEDKDLQFHHEVGSALWIRDLETITTPNIYQPYDILEVWWPRKMSITDIVPSINYVISDSAPGRRG